MLAGSQLSVTFLEMSYLSVKILAHLSATLYILMSLMRVYSICVCVPPPPPSWEVRCKVLYREAPPQGPTPYPFVSCVYLHHPLTRGAFRQKRIFWTFWRFSAWKSARLAPIYSRRHLQHDSASFFPPALRFTIFLLGHALKSFWTRK